MAASPAPTFRDFVEQLDREGELARVKARVSPVQEIVLEGDRADLTKLPLIQCWPLDGDVASGQVLNDAGGAQGGTGRYITFGGIHTRHPETGERNIGMYRVQFFGPRKCAMHWHM